MATPREIARERTIARITDIGFTQIDDGGPGAINLRAAARELNIVSSAIYRYVEDRNAYLTLLISAAFNQLADAVSQQTSARPTLTSVASAMRTWACEHPQRWGLIYGTPVVGSHAPQTTVAHGTKVIRILLESLADASPQPRSLASKLDAQTRRDLEAIQREWAPELDVLVIELAIETWSRIVGLISAEVFGYFGGDTITDPSALFTRSIERMAAELGMDS